ncbi:MAG: protein kinase [Planctomycetota bacterium]|nr:protein kinase [Planctomycetota bacterium]
MARAIEAPAHARDGLLESLAGDDVQLRDDAASLLRDALRAEQEGFLEPPEPPSTPAARRVHVGDHLGPYELVEVRGVGGLGVVYRARQRAPIERDVAVKVLHRPHPTPRELFRVEGERRAMAALDHPAIAKVLDAGVTPDARPFTVVEYVPGVPVTTYAEERRLGWRERVEIIVGACEALHHAHQRGVIHRDVKPENILAFERDGRTMVKIVDFGSARLVTDAGRATAEGGGVPGTLVYMSPEQLRGEDVPDTRTDIYALGLILYELLAGQLPWRDVRASVLEAMSQIGRVTLAELREPTGTSGRDLTGVCRCATAADRSRRYETMESFAADLRRVLRGETVSARAPSAFERAARTCRRHWRRLSVGIAVASLGLGLTAWALASRREATQRREELADTLEKVNSGVLGLLGNLSGARDTRRQIARTLLEPLQRLEASGKGDDRTRLALAAVTGVIGDLEETDSRYSHAHAHWVEAERLLRRVAEERPSDIDVLRRHATAVVRIGDSVHNMANTRDPAERFRTREQARLEVRTRYEAALGIQQRALELSPAHPGVLDDVSYSYARLSELAYLMGDEARAEELVRQRLDLSVSLAAAHPANSIHRYGVASARGQLAVMLTRLGRADEALPIARVAVEESEVLASGEPGNFTYQLQRHFARSCLFEALRDSGDTEQARREARAILDELQRIERENPEWRWTPERLDRFRREAGLDDPEQPAPVPPVD